MIPIVSIGGLFTTLTILLDTNFLLVPAQFGVDIYAELNRIISQKFELVIFQGILEELKEISKKSMKHQKQVQIALKLADQCKKLDIDMKKIKSQEIDEIIFELATQNNWLVATNDRALRKKLRAHLVPVIILRKRAVLSIEGDLPL
jgi:rRNA-processing protein FCF1